MIPQAAGHPSNWICLPEPAKSDHIQTKDRPGDHAAAAHIHLQATRAHPGASTGARAATASQSPVLQGWTIGQLQQTF